MALSVIFLSLALKWISYINSIIFAVFLRTSAVFLPVRHCRLVEVNGVSVVSATLKELEDILLQGTSAQIVVLRQPPLSLMSQQHPPDQDSDKEAVAMETTPQQNLIAI